MSLRVMGQAAVTMNQLQNQMDMIGHNLANSQTAGYKSRQAEFSNMLSQQITNMTDPENARNRLTPDGIRIGTGARLGAMNHNLSLGSIQQTGRDLDAVLLNEHQFFQVQVVENGEQEIRYTRDGSFYLQPVNENDVMLVTKDGHPVIGDNGPIQFAANFESIHMTEEGQIIVKRGTESEEVGNLAVAEIDNLRILEASGDNLFQLPDLAEIGVNVNDIVQVVLGENVHIQNQSLEMSNVSIQEQMTQLINAQRSYQFNSRSITMADQMQGLINQIR
ncbi:MAG TPA: flagellar hook-basal body protein [Pseudogracilibacillus sp.]|nr:flagellar hook-basal body protein [Pseudogracilibacillus sp.]